MPDYPENKTHYADQYCPPDNAYCPAQNLDNPLMPIQPRLDRNVPVIPIQPVIHLL